MSDKDTSEPIEKALEDTIIESTNSEEPNINLEEIKTESVKTSAEIQTQIDHLFLTSAIEKIMESKASKNNQELIESCSKAIGTLKFLF